MKPEGTAKTKAGLLRYKFVCPMDKWIYDPVTQKSHRSCCCDNPCTKSTCGRMVYIQQESNFRAYPGTIRGSAEWDNTYKIRTVVERDINHIKENLCLADKIQHHEYIRSLKSLIA